MSADVTPFPKPAGRVVNRDVQPIDRTPLDTGRCPVCGGIMYVFSRAHVVPKGQRGDDVPENVVWICGDGARGCHGVLTHRGRGTHGLDYATVAAGFVTYIARELPFTVAYVAAVKWDGWLDDYYQGRRAA